MRKKLGLAGIVLLLLLFAMQTVFASTGSMTISLNGTELEQQAVLQDGNIYLPLRAISEYLGYEVAWAQKAQNILLKTEEKGILLSLKTQEIADRGHKTYLTASPIILKNRTYIGADFFADNLALKMSWDKNNNKVQLASIEENAITITNALEATETKALKTTVQYPIIAGLGDTKIQNEINAIFKQLADSATSEGEQNAADLAPYILQYPDMPNQCETLFNYQLKYNQNGIISIVFINYQYAGGAHGSAIQTAYTINLETGQQYDLQELFKSNVDYATVISNNVKNQLVEKNMTAMLFQPFEKINENQNFYLSNAGVVVYYLQYEIMPYVAGIPEFTVDYALLKDLLKEPNIIKENLNEDTITATQLLRIRELAKQGKIFNCLYPVNRTVIEDVIAAWGQPSTSEYNFSAKGTYAAYPSHQLAFGYNKGLQVFEIQCSDSDLQKITLTKTLAILGKPTFQVTSGGEQIIGYQMGSEYKLIFYFQQSMTPTESWKLGHYEVLYPRGTVNLMADDPGRDWPVLPVGTSFMLSLPGNPTTGFTWHYTIISTDILQLVAEYSMPDSNLIGAGSTFTWDFKSLKPGNAKIIFKYYREWEGVESTIPNNIITSNITIR
ncbi:MAG: DUF4309 domain-containing protein [Clostridia bacterium]